MLKELDDDDWACVFAYAGESDGHSYGSANIDRAEGDAEVSVEPFTREDVAEIIAMDDGCNDGPDWIGVFRLNDGRFAFVSAGCDYTGWG